MRIVICEDDPTRATDLEAILQQGDHEVAGIFGEAEEALLHCWREPPDLVLLDLNLSRGPTGLSLAHAFGRMNIPVLIVRGQGRRAPAPPPRGAREMIEAR